MDIRESFKLFDLDDKEIEIYQQLLTSSWITALQLSRKSNIKRSSLYRVLERLVNKGLAEIKVDQKTTYYNASNYKQFETIVIDEEKRVQSMRSVLPDLASYLKKTSIVQSRDTDLHFFRGIQGLKYMEWKLCDVSKTEILIFDSGDQWYSLLGKDFAEEIRAEHVKQGNRIRELLNEGHIEPVPENKKVSWTENTEYILHHIKHRELPTDILKITQDIYIFNDTIHYHGYHEGDVVGIEIISADYASMMRQMFEVFWTQAKIVDNFGK